MTLKRTEFSSLTLVGLLIAAFCLPGCYTTVTRSASQAQPIPDISKLTGQGLPYYPVGGQPLRLKLPDVEVDVEARNLVPPSWPWPHAGDQLLVVVALSPKTDDVRFDPSRMRYQPEGGQPARPWLVQGPARKTYWFQFGSGGRFKTCISSYKNPDAYAPITGSVPVTKLACFRIFFNDDRTERRAFTLFIEGISTSGKPLAVPPVFFEYKIWETSEPIIW